MIALTALVSVPVFVDGERHRVPLGTWIGDFERLELTKNGPGDLIAAGDEALIERGGGEPLTLLVDGRPAEPGERVLFPVSVVSVAGGDVVEAVENVSEPIEIPVIYEGEGSLMSLAQPGHVGVRRITQGSISRQVLDSHVVEEAVPMVVRKEELSIGDRVVALTFDDGPWPGQTEAILDVLAAEEVKATFMMLGVQVRAHPAIAHRVVFEGHAVGNHTQTHRRLDRGSRETAKAEMDAAQATIKSATGVAPVWFRAPGGLMSPAVFAACGDASVRAVHWTVDPQDWSGKPAERIEAEVLAEAHPGAVVLLHDGGGDRSATIAALPNIIQGLKADGYTFVTLDEVPALAVAPAR